MPPEDTYDPTLPPSHGFSDPNSSPMHDPMGGQPAGSSAYDDPAFAAVMGSQADTSTLNNDFPGSTPAAVNPDAVPGQQTVDPMPPWTQPSAPASGQAPPTGVTTPASQTGEPGQAPQTPPDPNQIPVLTAEHMAGTESPEQKLTRLERQYGDSSREAIRLNSVQKSLSALLKDRGLELQVDKETNSVDFVLSKGAKGTATPSAKMDFQDLSAEDQALFSEDPQAAVNLVLGRANEVARTAIQPTASRLPEPASEIEHHTAKSFLRELKNADGSARYPMWDRFAGVIDQHLADANTSKALKAFVASNPQLGNEVLYALAESQQVNIARMHANAMNVQTNRANGSSSVPSYGPMDAGSTQLVPGQALQTPDNLGAAIAGSRGFSH